MPKYNRCMNCGSKPHAVLDGDRHVKRKDGKGWSLICPVCGMPSPKRGVTKAEAIASWNEYNPE